MKREHLLSAGRWRKISSPALNLNELVLTSMLLQCSAPARGWLRSTGFSGGSACQFSMPGFLRVSKSDFSIQEGSLGLYGPIAGWDLVSICPSTLFSILSQESHPCPISHGRVMRRIPMSPQVRQRSPSALGDVEVALE